MTRGDCRGGAGDSPPGTGTPRALELRPKCRSSLSSDRVSLPLQSTRLQLSPELLLRWRRVEYAESALDESCTREGDTRNGNCLLTLCLFTACRFTTLRDDQSPPLKYKIQLFSCFLRNSRTKAINRKRSRAGFWNLLRHSNDFHHLYAYSRNFSTYSRTFSAAEPMVQNARPVRNSPGVRDLPPSMSSSADVVYRSHID